MPSTALQTAQTNLQRVSDILSFHTKEKNPGVGAPPPADASLVLGATALTYAAWEAYVEDLAIEVVAFLSKTIPVSKVDDEVRTKIAENVPKWSLAGSGWRKVWRDQVYVFARGTLGTKNFGMNTADAETVLKLFALVGVQPFRDVRWKNATTSQVKDRLQSLVRDRGTVVHTAQLPTKYGLNNARRHREFVDRLLVKLDATVEAQVTKIAGGKAPW